MVLVSHTHKFIFFKTKKTASTSVEMFFEPFCLPEEHDAGPEYRDEYVGETGVVGARRGREKREHARWPQHLRASSVLRRTGIWKFLRYFKFATVRNPYTRTLSSFRYTFHRNPEELQALSFDEHRALFNRWLEEHYHWVQDKRMYTIAGVPVANAYIRFERLTEDIQAVCEHLGLPCDLDRLGHMKKMPEPDREVREYYEDHNYERLARTYRWELARFGYGGGDA